MKKIAIISPSILPIPAVYGGAVETLIQNFIDENELQRKVQCDVITVYDKNAEIASKSYSLTNFLWIKKSFFVIIRWSILRIINIIKRFFNPAQIGISYEGYIIHRILKNSDYDAVIVEGNGNQLHYLKNVISSDKLYFHIHSFYHCYPTEMNKYLMGIPSKIISVSQFIEKSLNENLNIPFENITVVKNCISSHFFTLKKGKTDVLIDKNKISIVFTGRIVKEKGVLELLDALYLIRHSNWQLFMIGSFGSDFGLQNCKKNSRTLNFQEEVMKSVSQLENRVAFLGYLPSNKLSVLYAQFDLAIVPSICYEAAGLTIGEFMSAGLPIIASNMGGIPEYLPNGAGIIVPNDEEFVEKLAESIKDLVENSEVRKQKSISAKKNAENYMPIRYYEEIIESLN